MRILIINLDNYPKVLRGVKRVSATLGKEWVRMGHEVMFVGMCPNDIHEESIEHIPQRFFPSVKTVTKNGFLNFQDIENEANLSFLCNLIQTWNADVLLNPHVNDDPITRICGQARERTHIPLINAFHFAPTHDLDILKTYYKFPLEPKTLPLRLRRLRRRCITTLWWLNRCRKLKNKFRYALSHADRLLLLSDRFIKEMNVLTLHYETSKLVCINNPFIFPPSTIPVKKEKVVIWCGQVEYGMKRTDRMLSIWKHLWRRFPDWQLIILGAGQISHFEDLARQHDIQNVRFMGFGNPLEWYRRGSILCVTSCTEGWGLTLVEAMSQRCATIAYGSYSAVYDIIEDGVTGYVVPNNRESIYVKRLATLMEDEDLRLKMGEAGEQRISRFDLSAIADKYIRLFTEVQNNH